MIRWIVQSCGDKKKPEKPLAWGAHWSDPREISFCANGSRLCLIDSLQAYVDFNVPEPWPGGGLYLQWPITSKSLFTHWNGCWQWQVRSITQLNKKKRYVFLLIYLVFITVNSKADIFRGPVHGAAAPQRPLPTLRLVWVIITSVCFFSRTQDGLQPLVDLERLTGCHHIHGARGGDPEEKLTSIN